MDGLPINFTDLIILAVLLLSALLAFSRGFVHELLGVGAWIGAIIATLWLFAPAQEVARDLIAIELLGDIAAGVAIFLVALILLSIISRMIGRRVRESSLGFLDRTLGVLFGLLRGGLLRRLLWLGGCWLMPEDQQPEWLTNAQVLPVVEGGAGLLRDLIPADVELRRAVDSLEEPRRPTVDLRTPGLQPRR